MPSIIRRYTCNPAGRYRRRIGHGLTLEHQFCKFMDRQVRTLTGAINGEKTQRNKAYTIKVTIHVPQEFTGHFGDGTRADGQQNIIVLTPRQAWVHSVDA